LRESSHTHERIGVHVVSYQHRQHRGRQARVTEPDIYYNANLVLLAAELQA